MKKGNRKRSKHSHNDKNREAEKSALDNDHRLEDPLYEELSSLESTSNSTDSASGSPYQDKLDKLGEVVIEFDIDFKEKINNKVLEAELALRNTSGGIIKIKSAQEPTVKDRDNWFTKLYDKRKTLLGSEGGEKDSFDDVLDIETEGDTTYIFVRKSSVPILTDRSHLRQRSEGRNDPVFLYSRISQMITKRKQRCICGTQGRNFIKSKFCYNSKLSYESTTQEHKLLENLVKQIDDKLSDNIVAFANTRGGTIYFGVQDSDARIRGQTIKDDQERDYIHHIIVKSMERKVWVLDSGEEDKPKEHDHYHIKFFPVVGADENKYIIAVHICAFPGAAVFKKKPECSVLDEKNQIVNLELKEWLSLHKLDSLGSESDKKKLRCQNFGRTVYYTVKDSIEDIYRDLIEASPGKLKIRPNHAMRSIPNKCLLGFIERLNKTFKHNEWEGIAFIERCWGVNVGFSVTKPAEVICDILVCCPNFPVLLVSLTEGEVTNDISHYNVNLAIALKRMLAQGGGCIEKFYVKPITLSGSKPDDVSMQEMISPTDVYPDAYQMSKEKYEAVIKALIPVLARVNPSVKGAVGKHLFHSLTKQQYKILFEDFQSPKLKISGPPGSGKTVLAIERIRRLRKHEGLSHKEVLFVCSNKWLENEVSCNKVIKEGNSEPLCLTHNFSWLIYHLKDKRERLARVKHIVIDEGQHFWKNRPKSSFDWWDTWMKMYPKKNCPSIWIFYDLSQKIMKGPCILNGLNDEFSERQLNTVIRTTGKIQRFIQRFLTNGPRIYLGHDLEGEDVDVLVPKRSSNSEVSNDEHLVYMLISLLKDMVEKGVVPGSIGVLFTNEHRKKHYRRLFDKQTRGCPFLDRQKQSEDGIMFKTIRIFSGGDKDVIVGFCPFFNEKSTFQDNRALMVSLCSRAKLKLILILENEKVGRSFKLTDCMKETAMSS